MNNETHDLLNSTPTFPDEIYEILPPFLKEILKHFPDRREKDIVLMGILVVLSGCFSNIRGKYGTDWYNPNLFGFIVAPPASGKGVMKYTIYLGSTIQAENSRSYEKEIIEYRDKLRKWQFELRNGETTLEEPKKPTRKILFIPGNSSAAAIYNLLSSNGGSGVICETEADTLSSAISQNWGDFSQLLRGSFEHEPLSKSRSGNDEYISIDSPRLSTLLSGTPDQVPRLISSADDGLFSRFLFYCFSRPLDWLDPTPCDDCIDLTDLFTKKSIEVAKIKAMIDGRNIEFKLTPEQFSLLNSAFKSKLSSITSFEGHDASSIVFRLGVICFRIAMIMAVLRQMDLSETKILTCTDEDFKTTLSLIDVFFEHSRVMYTLLPRNHSEVSNGRARQLYDIIPAKIRFTRGEINQIASTIGIRERSVNNYLRELMDKGLIRNIEFGVYEKIPT